METITLPDHTDLADLADTETALVSAAFEACPAFEAPGDGSPVCSGCGWLDAEHARAVADVRTLARRRPPNGRALVGSQIARRLAS